MLKGSVKFFDGKKGYGFITPEGNSEDVFVHHSGIQMEGFKVLKDGQKVTFETQPGRKGLQAVNVRLA